MSEDKYLWDDDFSSLFKLNTNNDYENLSKATVTRTLNEQDQTIKNLKRQLADAKEINKIIFENIGKDLDSLQKEAYSARHYPFKYNVLMRLIQRLKTNETRSR